MSVFKLTDWEPDWEVLTSSTTGADWVDPGSQERLWDEIGPRRRCRKQLKSTHLIFCKVQGRLCDQFLGFQPSSDWSCHERSPGSCISSQDLDN
jgi:hypothetical protein